MDLLELVFVGEVCLNVLGDVRILRIVHILLILPFENGVHESFDFPLHTFLVDKDALTLFLLLIVHILGVSGRCLLDTMFLVIGLLLCVFFSALVYRRLDVSDERFALDGLSAHEANVWVSFTRFHQLRHASQVLTPVTKLDLIEIRLNFGRRISRMREHLLFFFRRGENRDYFELFLEFLVHFSRLYEIGLILLIQSFSISVRVRFLEFHICFITLDRVVQKLLLIHASEIEGLLFDRYPPLGLRIQQSRGLFCRLLDRPGKVAGGRRVGDRLDEGGISRVVF